MAPLVPATLRTGAVEFVETSTVPLASPMLDPRVGMEPTDANIGTCLSVPLMSGSEFELEEGDTPTLCAASTTAAEVGLIELLQVFGKVDVLPNAAAATICDW